MYDCNQKIVILKTWQFHELLQDMGSLYCFHECVPGRPVISHYRAKRIAAQRACATPHQSHTSPSVMVIQSLSRVWPPDMNISPKVGPTHCEVWTRFSTSFNIKLYHIIADAYTHSGLQYTYGCLLTIQLGSRAQQQDATCQRQPPLWQCHFPCCPLLPFSGNTALSSFPFLEIGVWLSLDCECQLK